MKTPGGWVGHDRNVDMPPTQEWLAIKAEVFATYGDICWVCLQPGADQVDHVGKRWQHGIEWLRPIHDDPCHKRRTSQQGHEAQRKIRERGRMPAEKHPGLK